jgi:MarR family transcriptional regulator, negative regulator of the multidrug operon emrRAB
VSARVANLVGAHALEVGDRLRAAAESAAGQGGSAPSALVALANFADGQTVDQVARILGVSHSGTVRLVDRLAADGLVRRERGAEDARQVRVRITDEGRAAAGRILAARENALTSGLEVLSEGEQEQLARLLERLLAAATVDAAASRTICRLCDPCACGHPERCPVTQAARA